MSGEVKQLIELALWIFSPLITATVWWYRYNARIEIKYKEESTGAEALKKQAETNEKLQKMVEEMKEENRLNWVQFYKIQSMK